LVAFTQDEKSLLALKSIEALVTPSEGFFVGKHAAYLCHLRTVLPPANGATHDNTHERIRCNGSTDLSGKSKK
jgi:hypothetical protein